MARKTIKELQAQIKRLQMELKDARNQIKVPLDETDRVYFWLGRAAQKLRTERSITQEEMVAHLGITRTSLANMEAGKQRAPVHVWMYLAKRLKMSFSQFIDHADALEEDWAEREGVI